MRARAEAVARSGCCQAIRSLLAARARSYSAQPAEVKTRVDQTIPHVRNFLDCMKSRERPNAGVFIGHRSVQAAHLGNLAYEQKRRVKFDPIRERVLPL